MKRHPPPVKANQRIALKNSLEAKVFVLLKLHRKVVKRILELLKLLNAVVILFRVARWIVVLLFEKFPNATALVFQVVRWIRGLLIDLSDLL